MLQRQIAKWGLDKKHKAPEMRAILRIARQRKAAGKESVFRVRGRRVDIEEVYRYFRRKGEDPASIDIPDSGPIPPTVTVETPPLVPVDMGIATTIPHPPDASVPSESGEEQVSSLAPLFPAASPHDSVEIEWNEWNKIFRPDAGASIINPPSQLPIYSQQATMGSNIIGGTRIPALSATMPPVLKKVPNPEPPTSSTGGNASGSGASLPPKIEEVAEPPDSILLSTIDSRSFRYPSVSPLQDYQSNDGAIDGGVSETAPLGRRSYSPHYGRTPHNSKEIKLARLEDAGENEDKDDGAKSMGRETIG